MFGDSYIMRVMTPLGSTKSSSVDVVDVVVMPDGGQRPVLLRAERDALRRVRAAARRTEHLSAREHELHGSRHVLRRHRGEIDVRPRTALAAESAAGEVRDDPHVLRREPERARDAVA